MSTRSTRHSSRIAANSNKKNYDSEDSMQSSESRMSLRSSTRRGTSIEIPDNESNRKSSTSSVNISLNSNSRRRSGKSKREDVGSDMDIDVNSSISLKRRDTKRKNLNKRSRINSYDSTSTAYDSSVQLDESKQGTEDTNNSSSTTEKKKNPFGKKKREYTGDPPLNLNEYEKPFKNANYITPKKYKLLKQILLMDRNRTDIPIDSPLYLNIEAPPSVYPRKKYCDITGLKSIYTDPKTGLRYYDSTVYKYIQEQPQGTLQGYLGLRNAAVNLI